MNVLLIDGRPEVRAELKRCLAAVGINAIESDTGNEALLLTWRYKIAAIITDIGHDDSVNLTLLQHTKELEPRMPMFLLLYPRTTAGGLAKYVPNDRIYLHPYDPEEVAQAVYLACLRFIKDRDGDPS